MPSKVELLVKARRAAEKAEEGMIYRTRDKRTLATWGIGNAESPPYVRFSGETLDVSEVQSLIEWLRDSIAEPVA